MRGSKENWIAPYEFFTISEQLIANLCDISLERATKWECNFIDEALYLQVNDTLYEGTLTHLDMWSEYQRSIEQE